MEEFGKKAREINWENHPSNPKSIEGMRERLIKTTEDFINDC